MKEKMNRGFAHSGLAKEAGKLGGLATKKKHGREFFQEIGREGGLKSSKKGGQNAST